MKNPIGWFEIYVSDMDRARTFYETVLDVKLEALGDPTGGDIQMYSFASDMEQYGATGALVKMEGVPVGGGSVMVYFNCEDCAVEESRIEAAGGKLERPKFKIGEFGYISLFTDTEGNMLGLHSMA